MAAPIIRLPLLVGGRDIDPPSAPYPPETRAAGWHLQLDTTRIRQSDTWTISPPELRPWLLMLWLVAWEQAPCGTLPADLSIVRALIGMDPARFAEQHETLLRGWRLCDDFRLYHHVLTEHVLEMINARKKDRERQAKWRENKDKKRHALRSRVSHATGSGSGSGSGSGVNLPLVDKPTTRGLPAAVASEPVDPVQQVSKTCPHEKLIALYHERLPNSPRVIQWHDARQLAMRSRWREQAIKRKFATEAQALAWWDRFFKHVAKSAFLRGDAPPSAGRPPFVATLEWLVKQGNFAKVIEGNYHNENNDA